MCRVTHVLKEGKHSRLKQINLLIEGFKHGFAPCFLGRKIRANPKVFKKLLGLILAGIIESKIVFFVILGRDYSGQSLPKNTMYDTIACQGMHNMHAINVIIYMYFENLLNVLLII